MKIGAIIQARMGSQRLPGKVLKEVLGRPLLGYLVERARLCESIEQVVVATSEHADDDAIEAFCRSKNVECFRGSGQDVLDRMFQCAAVYEMEKIVRLTGDCPLIDPALLNGVIQCSIGHPEYDLVKTGPSYPEGFDAEILSIKNFEIVWQEAELESQREHVTTYLWENDQRFNIKWLALDKDYSFLRLTVDEDVDFEVVRAVLEELFPKKGIGFNFADILSLYGEKPDIFKKNAHIVRNEGYIKSKQAD